ncbi:MAG: leucine-rich repeat domain-containing protein [Clostridium sp.]|nr:leucine-rich repeat domain-containing protein [Clostridium sp.]
MKNLLKRALPVFCAFAIMVASLMTAAIVFADSTQWHYDEQSNTLYITGSGKMDNYKNEYSSPWCTYNQLVKKVVVEEGVTSIGDYAFAGFRYLSDVSIADTVANIGTSAFASCPDLNALSLGVGISNISDSSFAFNGLTQKNAFKLYTQAGSYALYYAVSNQIPFDCSSIDIGIYDVSIVAGGMTAYYPFTPNHKCTVKISTSGSLDTIGYIYDANFKELAYNDDGTDVNFEITYTLDAGKTYYFAAKRFDPVRTGEFKFNFDILSFTYNITAYAMADPDGTASDIKITDLLVNGEPIGEGVEFTFDTPTADITLTLNGVTTTVSVTPASANELILMPLDVNNDGYVNAKDFKALKESNSPYLPLFENFINYNK